MSTSFFCLDLGTHFPDEPKKDQEVIIEGRNEAFSDRKQTRKLDQASQRAHGQEVDKTID